MNADRILAIQLGKEREAIVLIQSHDGFAITSPLELIIHLSKHLRTELLVIVDFPIDDRLDGSPRVEERLMAAWGQIVDLQPSITKTFTTVSIQVTTL